MRDGPGPSRAPAWLVVVAAGAVVALGTDAVSELAGAPGRWGWLGLGARASAFGRPPLLGLVAALGAAWALAALITATDRLALARRLAVVLVVAGVFDAGAWPADPGLHVVLAGAVLLAAAPFLRPGLAGWCALAAVLLGLPAALGGRLAAGSVAWALAIAPPAVVALALPSLARPSRAGWIAVPLAAFALATGTVALAALAGYPALAHGLNLPLSAVADTRLRVAGLHPNLAVPHLVAALLAAIAVLPRLARPSVRAAVGLAAAAVAAALVATGSRTGALTAVAGLGVLAAGRVLSHLARRNANAAGDRAIPGAAGPDHGREVARSDAGRIPDRPAASGLGRAATRSARILQGAAVVLVALALVQPVTGWTESSITRRSDSMVSKAVSFRSAMWELGRDTFAAAPWTGFGPGTTFLQGRYARPSRYDGLPKDDHPHNVVLAVGAALGLPGLVGLALLLAVAMRRPPGGMAGPAGVMGDLPLATAVAVGLAVSVDMGSAVRTLLPSLLFLAAGVAGALDREAPRRDRSPHPVQPTRRTSGLAAALAATVGTGCLVAGAATAVGHHIRDTVRAEFDAALAAPGALAGTRSPEGPGKTAPWAHPPRPDGDAVEPDGAGAAAGTGAAPRSAGGTAAAAVPGAAAAVPSPLDAEALSRRLDRADLLLPYDPAVPWLRARLAAATGDLDARLRHLRAARDRFPDSAALRHAEALVRARRDLDDPIVDTLLDEAIAADPYGAEAWRRHADRAVLAAHRGDRSLAFDALVAALLLDPAAIRHDGVRPRPERDEVLLSADGTGGVVLPFGQIFAEVAQRRRELAEHDPASEVRLRMREVEIRIAAGQVARAEALARELLADEPIYLHLRAGQAARARGDWSAAADAFGRAEDRAPASALSCRAEYLEALAHADPLDEGEIARTVGQIETQLTDVLFEPDSVRRILRARERIARRRGEPSAAARWAAAAAFLGG